MSRAVLLQLPWWTAVLMIPLWSTPAPLPFLSTLLPSMNPPSSHWPTSRSIWSQCCRFWRNLKPKTLVLFPLPWATNLRVDILRQQGFLKMRSMDLNLQKSPMQWYRLAWAQTWRISRAFPLYRVNTLKHIQDKLLQKQRLYELIIEQRHCVCVEVLPNVQRVLDTPRSLSPLPYQRFFRWS